jgi:protein-S-isoprenylcysteine O-methyltransferase Ste14
MLPVVFASVLLAVCGLWWGLTVIAWIAWEKRFASPHQNAGGPLQDTEKKPTWKSKLVDLIEFGAPTALAVGLSYDGFTSGRLLYGAGWSIPIPFSEGFQILGTVLLLTGLPLFTVGAYLTGRYVYAKPPTERPLLQKGPYRFIRHPIYLAFILVAAGFILLALNLVMLPLVYVFTAIRYPEKEEPELIKLYGDTYREYQKRTGRFLPKFRRG